MTEVDPGHCWQPTLYASQLQQNFVPRILFVSVAFYLATDLSISIFAYLSCWKRHSCTLVLLDLCLRILIPTFLCGSSNRGPFTPSSISKHRLHAWNILWTTKYKEAIVALFCTVQQDGSLHLHVGVTPATPNRLDQSTTESTGRKPTSRDHAVNLSLPPFGPAQLAAGQRVGWRHPQHQWLLDVLDGPYDQSSDAQCGV